MKRIFYVLLALAYLVLMIELFKRVILAAPYYSRLSQANSVREKTIPAPRGVFYDRDGILLVKNSESKNATNKREYLFPELFAHTLGYMSLPGDRAIKDISCGSKALPNQPIGAYGLEKTYECRLRGVPGKGYTLSDASGILLQEYGMRKPYGGESITLSLSKKLHEVAAREMKGKKGAVMVTDTNGHILVLYSSPSFNANKIMYDNAYGTYANDKAHPLFNRAVNALYPPGSVVKPALALMALSEKLIDEDYEVNDTGNYSLGGINFGNWYFLQYGKTEGPIKVVRAIARSNDIFFYQLGVKAGIERLYSWYTAMRFAQHDIAHLFPQANAVIPNGAWKKSMLGEQWYVGDTVNMSIGQGFIQVSPVQVHSALSIIANDGKWCSLEIEKNKKAGCRKIVSDGEALRLVQEGMRQACSEGGTGWPLFSFAVGGKKIPVACKTGTAESQSKDKKPHAWFSAYAPFEKPEIIVTVVLENGGEGSTDAAPIAKALLTSFFTH